MSENQRFSEGTEMFSGVFKGYKMEILARNGLKNAKLPDFLHFHSSQLLVELIMGALE